MIRNSIRVAALAVLLSLVLHITGLVALFNPGQQRAEEPAPEPADSAAFEDFAEEALEPEEPEPTPEIEPEELVQPDDSSDIQVASETPRDVVAPDSGTASENIGQIEPTEEVTATAPPAQGTDAPAPAGTPDAPPETAPLETEDIAEATEPEVTDAIEEAIEEALDNAPELEAVEDGELLAAAVTRSPRPPVRPTEETFGIEDSDTQSQEQVGVETAAIAPQTGLDILAEAGRTALYGRSSLENARATGNSTVTNYRGEVFQKLNRSLRVYRNEKGSAVLRFQILPDGQVGWVRVIRSRGSPNINIAAAANVRNAAPFPRPPDGKPIEMSVTFQNR